MFCTVSSCQSAVTTLPSVAADISFHTGTGGYCWHMDWVSLKSEFALSLQSRLQHICLSGSQSPTGWFHEHNWPLCTALAYFFSFWEVICLLLLLLFFIGINICFYCTWKLGWCVNCMFVNHSCNTDSRLLKISENILLWHRAETSHTVSRGVWTDNLSCFSRGQSESFINARCWNKIRMCWYS